MTKNWRLTSCLDVLLINNTNDIYLVPTGKKTYINKAISSIPRDSSKNSISRISIDKNKFEIKFSDSLDLLVKSEGLPNDKWYHVVNFLGRENVNERLNACGRIFNQWSKADNVFEAAFSDESGDVFFVNKDMKEYRECHEEMVRQLNCSMKRQTSNLVAGHRYDSRKYNTTLYFLGTYSTRRSNFDAKLSKVYLFTDDPGNASTISEVFKSTPYIVDNVQLVNLPREKGGRIISMNSSPGLMVDGGETLVDDVTNLKSLWPDMFNKLISDNKKVNEFGRMYYENPADIINLFSYSGGKNDDSKMELSDEIRNKLKDVLRVIFRENIIRYWEVYKKEGNGTLRECKRIGHDLENVLNCERVYLSTLSDLNDWLGYRQLYYKSLFENVLKISKDSIDSIILEEINNWETKIYNMTLAEYIKVQDLYYSSYIEEMKYIFDQRSSSANFTSERKYLSGVYSVALRKVIVDLIDEARNNFGNGVDEYLAINVGTRRHPKEYLDITISINNIIDHFGGDVGNVPENIANELVKLEFRKVNVKLDKISRVL